MKLSIILAGVSMGALLLGGATASAAPVSLQVCGTVSCWSATNQIADGVVVNMANVETLDNAGGTSVNDWEAANGLNMENWSLSLDSDPFVTNNFTITNSTGSTQTYSVAVTLGVAPAIANGAMRGSIGFSLTDSNNTATLATDGPVLPIYRAMIDGTVVRNLWNAPQSFSTTFAGETISGNTNFGIPIREAAPESVDTDIGILIRFSLTSGDSVAFTSIFDVVPVPVPAAVWLFGSGLLGLFGLSRHKRR